MDVFKLILVSLAGLVHRQLRHVIEYLVVSQNSDDARGVEEERVARQ
ncbi:MAG: hypothetical protein ACI8XO_000991 [Verrucomicrobiales bacterium]|jgi:hypothetical protein